MESSERESTSSIVGMSPGGVVGLGCLLPSAWSVRTSHLTSKLGLMPFPLLGLRYPLFPPCFPKPFPYCLEILFILQASSRWLTAFSISKLAFHPPLPLKKEVPLSDLLSHSLSGDSTSYPQVFPRWDLKEAHPSGLYSCPRHVPDCHLARVGDTCILIWNLESGWLHRSPQWYPSFLPAYFVHSLVCLPYCGSRISTCNAVPYT